MNSSDDIIHQEILQAALRLYRKSGPTNVTMDNLAKATGRSRSSLYYYFKNRDEVFKAVLNRIAEDVAAEIHQAVITAVTIKDKLLAFCMAKIKTSQEWKQVFSTMDQLANVEEQSKHTQMMEALHKKLMYLERGILVEAFFAADGQAAKKIDANALDVLAFIITTGIRGIRREVYDYNDPHDAKAAAVLLSDMAVKWLEK